MDLPPVASDNPIALRRIKGIPSNLLGGDKESVEIAKKAVFHIGAFDKKNELVGFISLGNLKGLPKWLSILAMGASPKYVHPKTDEITLEERLLYGALVEAQKSGFELVVARNLTAERKKLVEKINRWVHKDLEVEIRNEKFLRFTEEPDSKNRKPGQPYFLVERKAPAIAKFRLKRR